ncbi:TPA: hypothetical protein J1040_004171 [Escherichia coli]|nr:hypothetical protein [Escherichia coli]
MLHTTNPVIKHKAGLLNLAEELSNVSKACKIMGEFINPASEHIGAGITRVLLVNARQQPWLR